MKHTLICLASVLAFAACGVESPPTTESPATEDSSTVTQSSRSQAPTVEATSDPDPAPIIGTCSTRSLGSCKGQPINTVCSISPRRLWCLPAQELPDGEIFCLCQSQSTI